MNSWDIAAVPFLKILLLLIFIPLLAFSQEGLKWRAHDMNRPRPEIITPPARYLPVPPPSDAVVLFDRNDLSLWEDMEGNETKWICRDDYFECVKDAGYIRTKQAFGDVQLHIEWAAPLPVIGESQGRGNSGVFLMGKYEVQVLDSYENITYADGQAAAVYGQYPPQVNACRPPGEWQSYDIVFHRPHFDSLGKLMKPARMTVFHNGVLVQDNVELWGGTEWLKYSPYEAHPDRLPLSLQDHGNPVRFRNVWLRELSEEPEAQPQPRPMADLTADVLKTYVGVYTIENDNEFKITLENGTLWLTVYGNRRFELIPYSKENFSVKFTAIDLVFSFDRKNLPSALEYHFTGDVTKAQKVK